MKSAKRRLEMVEGSSSKFWEVAIDGASFTVTYGRIGTGGTSKTTVTSSVEAAEKEVAALVREKLKKGYQDPEAGPTFRPPTHIGTMTHVERFMNYKVVALNPDTAEEGESEDGRRELPALRELDKLVFWVGASYDDTSDVFTKRLDALLADPKVGELRALLIGNWFGDVCDAPPKEEVYDRLIRAGGRLASLRGLFLGDITQEEHEISWIQQGDCGSVINALPTLEELVVRGGGLRFTGLAHETLHTLTVQTGGLSKEALKDITHASLPKLRRLTLWLGDANYGGDVTVRDLDDLLGGERFAALEHLGLQDSGLADEIAVAVARSPLLARLHGLDLSMGTLGDVGAEALLASPHLRSLEYLNVRHHYMSPAMTAKIRALDIEVNVADRQDAEHEDDRYVEVSE